MARSPIMIATRLLRCLLLPVGLISCLASATAQSGTKEPAFDAVSVKRSPDGPGAYDFSPTRIVVRNFPLDLVFREAYALSRFEVVGLPDWLAQERFEIVGTTREPHSSKEMLTMLQSVFEDRFALRSHRESRERPVFALERVSATALGPGLTPPASDCALDCQHRVGAGSVEGHITWAQLFSFIRRNVDIDRLVVDRSGLSGAFHVSVQWPTRPSLNANSDADVPSLFTALREQLGLRLEPRNELIEVMVIDSIQRPTPD